MIYNYNFAGINFRLTTPFEINIGKESKEFISNELVDDIDDVIDFMAVPSLDYEEITGHWESFRWYTKDMTGSKAYHCSVTHGDAYACMYWPSSISAPLICEYNENELKNVYTSHSICNIIGIEDLLLRHNGLLLHSSFICWNNRGILFSAPSGTGKSTQADLWVEHEGAEVLNGDRAAIRKMDGIWTAYGLPYAGSSGIYKNKKAPLKAIVLLKQAEENHIRKASLTEAVTFLYPEFTIHRWDQEFSEKALDLILQLLAEVPVYMLECRPDREAVSILKDTLI